jgi:uncharacterized protein YcbK (DUF882 family)
MRFERAITPHFSVDEFRSHDGVEYPAEWIDDRLRPLCALLEQIRAACGDRSIYLTSGYRSPSHNAAVGGAQLSQHVEGRAVDLVVDGMAPSDVHHKILMLAVAGKLPLLGGLGVYPRWVHVDTRDRPPSGHLARWTGVGVGSEL